MNKSSLLKISYGAVTLLAILMALIFPLVGFYLAIVPIVIAISLYFFQSKKIATLFLLSTLIVLGPLTTCISLYSKTQDFMNESPENKDFVSLSLDLLSNSSVGSHRNELAYIYISEGVTAIQNDDKEALRAAIKELQVIQQMPTDVEKTKK